MYIFQWNQSYQATFPRIPSAHFGSRGEDSPSFSCLTSSTQAKLSWSTSSSPWTSCKASQMQQKETKQQHFDRVLNLFIAETTQPICVVDDLGFRQLISIANYRLTLPSRRTLTGKMIDHPENQRRGCCYVITRSLDVLRVRERRWDLRPLSGLILLLTSCSCCDAEMLKFKRKSLTRQLSAVMERFEMNEKVIACALDGDFNTQTWMCVFNESLPAHNLTGSYPFKGACMAHKQSLILNHLLGKYLRIFSNSYLCKMFADRFKVV